MHYLENAWGRGGCKGVCLLVFMVVLATNLVLQGCSKEDTPRSSETSFSTGYTLYLSASKSSILSNDIDTAQINVEVRKGSVGQAGVNVTFSASGGRLAATSAATGANGKASVAFTSGPGADNQTVTITAAINGATTSVPLQITGGNNNSITMGAMTFGVDPLSAYGTTSVSVNVLDNDALYNTPVKVSFSSPCATANKTNLTASVTTINGVATASYVDNACAGNDTVTASIANGPSQSATLHVNAPDSGAITFVSAAPATITLRGTGGAGSSEFSRVIFKVVDSAGNPIGGKSVSFALSTNVGGITLSTPAAISDATTGQVSVDVHAGVVGTPVRVSATTLTDAGTVLATQSNALVISTGFPDQDSSSLSVEKFNIEGLNIDGITTKLTMRLADHFNNPVPDGTAVFFTTEGGSITPSCATKDGACSATLTSQNPRPADGRVTVLAYAIGEESFSDLDGDGLADLVPREIVDDMQEAWLDSNRNGAREYNEPFIDFNNNGIYDGPDGKFNTNLCNETPDPSTPTRVSSPGSCSARKSIHVRRDTEIVFSGSYAVVSPAAVTLSSCGAIDEEILTVVDGNGNPLPAGSKIELTASGGIAFRASGEVIMVLDTTESFEVGNFNKTGDATTNFAFPIVSSNGSGCASGDLGSIEVIVTTPTPSGVVTRKNIAVSVL
ncbi:MAG: hypothetical protein HGA96_02135 [Desulfobulbaceae bacterium]|nr:hypothetical protein [Desulfobulbaceae bacterium]